MLAFGFVEAERPDGHRDEYWREDEEGDVGDMGSPIFDEHSVEHGITGRVGGFSEE